MNRPSNTFPEFQRAVVDDPRLLEELAAFADAEEFCVRTVEAGAARGFVFTVDEVRGALQAARRAWIERNLA